MSYLLIKFADRVLNKLLQANGRAQAKWVRRQLKHRRLQDL